MEFLKKFLRLGRPAVVFDSWDRPTDEVLRGIRLLRDAGVNLRSRTNWYVYLDNDDDFDSALERCEILRAERTTPYIMVNRQAARTQRMTDLKRWTRPHVFWSADFAEYRRERGVLR